jgi:hypothetical protein
MNREHQCQRALAAEEPAEHARGDPFVLAEAGFQSAVKTPRPSEPPPQ